MSRLFSKWVLFYIILVFLLSLLNMNLYHSFINILMFFSCHCLCPHEEEMMLTAFTSFHSILYNKLALDSSVYTYGEYSFWFIVLVFLSFWSIFCCELYLARFRSCVWPTEKKKNHPKTELTIHFWSLQQNHIF